MVWAAQTLPILRRQLDRAPAEDRPLVAQRIRALERDVAAGWHPVRLAGRVAWNAKYWIARLLPRRAAEPVIQLARTVQELLRRA